MHYHRKNDTTIAKQTMAVRERWGGRDKEEGKERKRGRGRTRERERKSGQVLSDHSCCYVIVDTNAYCVK